MKKSLPFFLLLFFSFGAFAQQSKEKLKGWHLLDQTENGYMGISLNKAYELLKGKKSNTVIVAVIDSGIDTLHQDLKEVLWRNPKETPGNGQDDDGNGYVDDIHGWNFCGNKEGENLSRNTYEIARVYHGWRKEFEGKSAGSIPADKKFIHSQWVRAAQVIEKEYEEASKTLPQIVEFMKGLEISSEYINSALSVDRFSINQLSSLSENKSPEVKSSAAYWKELFSQSSDTSTKNTDVIREVTDYKNQLENKIKRKNELPEDFRGQMTKDNYTDINDKFYGNNNLTAGSGNHGTLVAGIIGAKRNNGLGMDGIADNVQIMALRAVPGGDEHDKDIALAIRYAVDNGAKVINMSFGKPVSPYKQFVDDAVKYAAKKGVLLVHGSGNDSKDITKETFYPNPEFINGERAVNFITVGASGDQTTGGYAAPFSNYSNKWVDIFAPGMYIYSTAGNNGYESPDGTSMASPVVAGVAALLLSYFPDLTPEKIITILTASGTTINEEVTIPGKEKKTKFSTLSSSGKVVNAYEAVKSQLAD